MAQIHSGIIAEIDREHSDPIGFHDDLQLNKVDWRNRNKIRSAAGILWQTVPGKYRSTTRIIQETEIDYAQLWQQKRLNLIKETYLISPFSEQIYTEFMGIIFNRYRTFSEHKRALIKWIIQKMEIRNPVLPSSELSLIGVKIERLIDILSKPKASAHISVPSAAYNLFGSAGIEYYYKSYDHKGNKQQCESFQGNVNTLDLLFNVGCGKNHI